MNILGANGVCGTSDLQPSCATFGTIICAAAIVAICFITFIGRLLFRRRLERLLIASAVLMALAPLAIIVPVIVMGHFLNKLSGAIVVMMLVPISMMLLIGGIGCFLVWATQIALQAFRNKFEAQRGWGGERS
jgi:protein-S-isoprenylcysteine O-methyltransferase Ste14